MWSAATSRVARAAQPTTPPPPTHGRARPRTALAVVVAAVAVVAAAATGASALPAPSSAASPTSAAPQPPPPPPPEEARFAVTDAATLDDGEPSTLGIVKPCRRADPNLGSCVRDAFNAFIHQQFAGVPELGLESFDPLQMPYVNLSEAVPGNMTLSLLLRGVYVRGFSKADIIHVRNVVFQTWCGLDTEFWSGVVLRRANPEEQKLELMCRVPWLTADGVFSAEGQVLTFPLSAQGPFSVNMSEVSSSCIIYFSEQSVKKGGPKYFTVDHLEFDFTPVDVSYYFGDTLDGDNQLGEAMNMFLNSNAHEVFGDVKGRVTKLLSHTLHGILNTVMEAFPADSLLLPD